MSSFQANQSFSVSRCYDSHVHWLPTGQMQSFLDLHKLSDPGDVRNLEIKKDYYRGAWLIGFGWNQHNWTQQSFPDKSLLDEIFPDTPVYFSRADGHAVWTNSSGLRAAGLAETRESEFPSPPGGTIVRGSDGFPTGVLIDKATSILEQKVPPYSADQLRSFLQKSTREFNQAGFTHIRDLGGDPEIWGIAQQMDSAKELTLAVEMNFTCKDLESFDQALHFCSYARGHATAHLRAPGVKLFLDGALGSEGAYLSQPYSGSQNRGLLLCKPEELREMLRRCWEAELEASVHAIGDEACHMVAVEASALYEQGVRGVLNVEHGEVIRDETIQLLKNMRTRVHLQPCHWWTDKKWLKEKLGDLYSSAFPWRKLEEAGVEMFFGSDSPIEPAAVSSNLRALDDSAVHGIGTLRGDALIYHTHPDPEWCPDSHSRFQGEKLIELVFDGQRIDIEELA